MRIRWFRYIGGLAWAIGSAAPGVSASVDLVLSAQPDSLPIGRYVDVELRAVSDEGTEFTAVDVVLTWDPAVLELVGVTNRVRWFMAGFLPDPLLDGLNAPFAGVPANDGDALYQGMSLGDLTATADGLLLATFRFSTVADAPAADIVIDPSRGMYSASRVLAPGAEDVTGTLEGTTVTVASDASLSVVNLTLPAGRTGEVIVSGDIAGAETFGVTIALELSSGTGSHGAVVFTPAPPVDIGLVGDPWVSAGMFTPLDTDAEVGSENINGAALDDGSHYPSPVTFSGGLASFPVTASGDAHGVWDLRLCAGACTPDEADSSWASQPTPVPTALYHGVLTVVAPGDGNGSETIDLRDVSEFQRCFTGGVGPMDPPAYPPAPGQRCRVYDFDDDGDVDIEDHAAFGNGLLGPAP